MYAYENVLQLNCPSTSIPSLHALAFLLTITLVAILVEHVASQAAASLLISGGVPQAVLCAHVCSTHAHHLWIH